MIAAGGELNVLHFAFLVASYAFLGGAIKYIDQAYDEGIGSITIAKILAIASGVLMGACMIVDGDFSTAFFLAMLISLVLTKKIDNVAFLSGTIIGLVTFIIGSIIWGAELSPLPIVVFLVAGAVDEIADGYAHGKDFGKVTEFVLHYRPFSDLALVLLILIMPYDWHYIAPYFAFTFAYMFIGGLEEGQVSESVRGILRKASNLRP
ncbi:MAG: hypothetical protein NT131_00550 [Methanomassiliicoccales archaeon]|nr:hypothetical protein [Methanomassiliicoccales archaeon]